MPSFFHVLSQYFWVIALGFGLFNYRRALKHLPPPPIGSQRSEGLVYLRRVAFAANLPWLVMGTGQLLGYTPTVWHYFRPQDANPFVIAWLAVILALTSAYAWWVLFAGGATKVLDFNLMAAVGQPNTKLTSLWSIKLFAVLGLLVFPVWVYLAAKMNAPLPS